MDNQEAQAILSRYLGEYRKRSYADLAEFVDLPKDLFEIVGDSGVTYYLDIYAFWDDKALRHVRLCGAIDDAGWRAFFPLTDSFILAPDGTFIGE